jgi:hypothetical protein
MGYPQPPSTAAVDATVDPPVLSTSHTAPGSKTSMHASKQCVLWYQSKQKRKQIPIPFPMQAMQKWQFFSSDADRERVFGVGY